LNFFKLCQVKTARKNTHEITGYQMSSNIPGTPDYTLHFDPPWGKSN